jgi:GAF domain-containing protein
MTEQMAEVAGERAGKAGDVRSGFDELARLLRDGRTPQETCAAIASAAVRVIGGCDHAGVAMLSPDGNFITVSSTGPVVDIADEIQREVGEGPCLEASAEEKLKHDPDLTHQPAWPAYAARLLEQTPVRASLACPLVLAGRRGGALNLFSERAHAFTEDDVTNAALLASFASVAVAAALEREQAAQLRVALDTNRTIGAAIGILMATHRMSQEDAFRMLATASQRLNRKLRDLAADIVRSDAPGGS